ncbi:MAG: Eco57I restriction-modification methylase domain-containing protein, partial [Planctomycetota bacterium]
VATHVPPFREACWHEGELSDDQWAPHFTSVVMGDALRAVISRCIYGVDINPMAVELCQFSLWIEALSPGRPLGFLRHHIRCGNSLMGARADRLGQGIPDDAFAPIEGDDRKIASEFKKLNKEEREAKATQGDFFMGGGAKAPDDYLARVRALETDPEETVADIMAKDRAFDDMRQEATYRQVRLRFDVWCAAFAQRKVRGDAGGITTGVLRRVERNPYDISPAHFAEVRRLSEAYRFFHMEAEFPTVFAAGGFDCVLGNPPWEHTEIKLTEWFAAAGFAEIAEARNDSIRRKLIAELETTNPKVYAQYLEDEHKAEAISLFARGSGMFPLCGQGRINTYALFAELNRNLTGPTGRAGTILPSGIATDERTSGFFSELVKEAQLVSWFDFENRNGIFADVDRTVKFCLLTVTKKRNPDPVKLAAFCHEISDLMDEEKVFTLLPEEFKLLNPNNGNCVVFKSKRSAEITKAIYQRMPVLWRREPEENPWGVSFRQGLFNMAFDSGLFRTEPGEGLVRLYEAKMLHQFDHRWATYETINGEVDSRQLTLEEKQNPAVLAQPQYWVPRSEV